jgi:hypothetical protein
MSVEAMSRIAAILALDGRKLSAYLDRKTRPKVMSEWLDQLEESNDADRDEIGILESGDLNRVFGYIASHLPKPIGGDERGKGG